ncbi:MAG: MFS transporter [Acidimicrobiia bacterium]|nr:MFS transporter [Acidimicrobiia bacterium]
MRADRTESAPTRLGAGYWKLWTASVTSNLGDGISTVAYPWLASAVTRDPIQIAGIAVATRLPWLIFTLPAGVITDRLDRRKIIIAMDVARMLITVGVAVSVLVLGGDLVTPDDPVAAAAERPEHGLALLIVLYGSALLFGFAEVLRDNAAQTILPSIVDAEQLETANGRMWGAEMVMNSFVGPPLGGVLIAIGFSIPFFVDAGTFGVAAVLIAAIGGARLQPESPPAGRKGFRAELAEGIGWLWNHRLLKRMGIILGVMNGTFAAAMAVYVLFVQEILGLDASSFGLLLTGGAIGGVIGSVAAARVSRAIGPGASLFSVLLAGAVTLGITGTTSSALVVWAMFVLFSFSAVLWNVITVSLRQTIIPDELLGRVNSVYRFLAWGMMPIGSILGGVAVSITEALSTRSLGLRMPFLIGAVVHLGLYLYARPVLNTANIEAAKAEATAHRSEPAEQ